MLREFRQLQKIVGRRDAIRYGGLGLVGLALAACGKKNDDGGPGATTSDKRGKATLAGATVEAFVRGSWNLSFTPQGQVNDEYALIEITGRRWSLDNGDTTGSFELSGDRVQVRLDQVSTDNVWTASGMPGRVADSASLTLQWGHDESAGQGDPGSPVDTTPFPLPVTWDGTTLKIQAKGGVLITAVRA
ncbi:hypothetical protein SGFS_103820 [Streptomyces graminofaciens]|uniref:Lipocalin-like domain-containing protein n=1 Tax=Streptomyces graminofaciens TaxID=68212 RepID=A0ABN5W5U4_9ACTN|nr:hypothetical protein SGFS_103820 [Streptomyces graminofaciens]